MSTFADVLHHRTLVADGAIGTMLHAAGNSLDRALPELNLSQPELVSAVHERYVGAGVDLILTNTFGASRLRLGEHGFTEKVTEINRAGVRLARQAATAAGRTMFVGGSVAPAVSASQRPRLPAAERVGAVREQVAALAGAGVDLLVLETFGYLDELVEAVGVAAEVCDLPILAQATFTPDGRTPGGQTPGDVVSALGGLPVAVIGANCTVGPQRMLDIVEQLRRATSLPISAQPNAGLPRRARDRQFEYSVDHDYFARYARRCADAGASIVGGCCGTTPGHLKAVVAAVARRPVRPAQQEAARPPTTERFGRRLAAHKFVVAAEVAPPLGDPVDEVAEIATALRTHGADLVLVPAVRGQPSRHSSASFALRLQQQARVEAIPTITTWDKTIMSLQADLLGAHAFGTRTVVCETGNPLLRGDYPNADGVWEVDSVGLIELLTGLNTGRDCNGLPLAMTTAFLIGARCNPGAENLPAEIARTRSKIAAGAQFLITRPVYEPAGARRMLDELGPHRVPTLLTVSALRGFAEAEYLSYEVPDVTIPRETLAALEAAGAGARETGIRLAMELLREARSLADGVVVVVRDSEEATRLLTAAGR
ncbi:methionine synthase [Prauserella coralliicola]|nr:methionine synthase [Prauserella coralliicola]